MAYALKETATGNLIQEASPDPRVMTFPAWGDALHYAKPLVDAQGNRTVEVVEFNEPEAPKP